MAKDKLTDYSATNASNTDVGGVNINEGMLPSDVNNAIREVMTHLKDFAEGTEAVNSLAVDNININGNTISSTDTNGNINITPNGSGAVAFTTNATFGDNDEAVFGSGTDLRIYHNSSNGNSHITESGSGSLVINGDNLYLQNTAGTENYIAAISNDAVTLYHDNSPKLATTATGVSVTGGVVASGGLSIDSYGDPSNNYITLRPSFAPSASGGVGFAAKDHDGANNDGLGVFGHDGISFTSGGSERMRLTSSGRLGLGTTLPVVPLQVKASSPAVSLQASASKTSGSRADFNAYNSDVSTVGYIRFGAVTDNVGTDRQFANRPAGGSLTERMRLDSSGNLLVGTTTVGGNGFTFETNGFATFARASGAAQSMIGFKNGGSFVGEIRTSTTATAYLTSSDHRLKENVTADWDATTRLKQLNPVRFNFIADADTTVDGFLAHEVQDIVPEAITGTHNEVDDEGNPVYQGIDQSKLVPLLVKTIQELEARIAALEAN